MHLRKFSAIRSRCLGVTLIEMLMAFVILGLLASLAVPAYRFLIQNQRAVTMSDQLSTAFAYARTEALKQASPVTVCSAADASLNVCGNNGDWANGWIVFRDPNSDGIIANAGDRLRTHEAFAAGTNIVSALSRVTYAGSGFLDSAPGTFTLTTSDCVGNHGRQITISATGRSTVATAICP